MYSNSRDPKKIGLQRKLHERAKELRKNSTVSEKHLWSYLRARRLCGLRFSRQWPIDRYIVDFYNHRYSLIIEVDGDIHATRNIYDQERDSRLIGLGYTVLRITNDQVLSNTDGVLKKILFLINPSSLRGGVVPRRGAGEKS